MPVTTRPSPQLVGKHKGHIIGPAHATTTLFEETIRESEDPYRGDPRRTNDAERMLLGSSFSNRKENTAIIPYGNGFVNGIIRAFNKDLHLVLRPDDVWLSILSQFSFYVNGNAEVLRHLFVTHQGQKTLTVDVTPFSLDKLNLGRVAQEFSSVIQENVVDETLKEWMLPSFSTSTDDDKSVASFVMMGTLKRYFRYSMYCGCGFPSVTLLGERSDWEKIQSRIDKFANYGPEPAKWATLLKPVLRHMLLTFDEPDSPVVKDFWLRVAHEAGREGSGQGIRTLSGWITAFAFWKEDGKMVYNYTDDEVRRRMARWDSEFDRKRLVLDGVSYPLIRPSSIPLGVVTLPMTIGDKGADIARYTTVLAGSVGMSLSDNRSTVAPLSGWWVRQEFTQPLKELLLRDAERSVAGSTTDGTTVASDASSAIEEYDNDSDFDDAYLP
jgi:hypothetical protein